MPPPPPPFDPVLAQQALEGFASALTKTGNAGILRDRLAAKQQELNLRIANKATTYTKEFAKSLDQLNASTTFVGRSLGDLVHHAKLSSQALEESISSFKNFDVATESIAKKLTEQFAKAGISYGRAIEDLSDILEVQEGVKALEELVKAQTELAQDTTPETVAAFNKIRQGIIASNLPEHFKDIARRAVADSMEAQEELQRLSTAIGSAASDARDFGASVRDNAAAIRKDFGKALKEQIEKLASASDGFTRIQNAVQKGVDTIYAQVKFGSQLSIAEQQAKAFTLALDPQKLAELEGRFRQAARSMGGTGQFLDRMAEVRDEFRNITGSPEEAAETMMESADLLSRSGIKPTTKGMRAMNNTIKNFTKLGVPANESLAIYNEVASDAVTRTQLLAAATAEERERILQTNVARIQESMAIGATKEQALAAAKGLSKLAGQTIQERFTTAAKAQQAFGVLGIGGGGEVANIIRGGRRAVTGEEGERNIPILQQRFKEAEARISQLLMSADLGEQRRGEIAAQQLDSLKETMAALNPALVENRSGIDDATKSTEELRKTAMAQIASQKTVADIDKQLVTATHGLQDILTQLHMPLTQIALGVTQLAAGGIMALLGGGGLAALGGALGGALGSGLAGATGALSIIGGALGVGAAGAIGYAVGTAISSALPDTVNDVIGSAFAKTLALFGNEEAKQSVRATYQQEMEAKNRGSYEEALKNLRTKYGGPNTRPEQSTPVTPAPTPTTLPAPTAPMVAPAGFTAPVAMPEVTVSQIASLAATNEAISKQLTENNETLTEHSSTLTQVVGVLSDTKMVLQQLLKGQTDHFAWIEEVESDNSDLQRKAARLGAFTPGRMVVG